MRSWLLPLLSLALPALAAPPAQVEMEYELRRNGAALAEVHAPLLHGNGSYELTETWKGRGFYRLLGRAKRVSRGTVAADGLRPVEFFDERTGRDTARAWFDWKAGTITSQYKGKQRMVPLPPRAQDRL